MGINKSRVLIICCCTVLFFTIFSITRADQQDFKTLSLTEEEQQWLVSNSTVRVSGPQAFPPFQFYDEEGKYVGLATDYISLIASFLNLQIEFVDKMDWSDVLDGAKNGTIDLLTCATENDSRKHYLSFSKPHLSYPLVIISRKETSQFTSPDDLQGSTIAIKKDISTIALLKEHSINYKPYYISTPLEALRAVSDRKADVALENLAAASYLLDSKGLTNLKIAAHTQFASYSLSIAVRKDLPLLLSAINKALDAISEEHHKRIRQKWIPVRYELGISFSKILTWFLGIGAFVCTIFLLIFTWNRRLVREITVRKQVEEQLNESERRLSTLISNLPGMAYRCRNEPSWPMDFISDGCKEITGYTPEEICTRANPEYGDVIHHEDQQYVWRTVQKSIENFHPFEIEYRIVTRSDEVKWVWERGGPVHDTISGEIYLEGFISDITEQKANQAKLQQSQKMEAIGTLAGGIAHDFNNILQAILGYAELISNELKDRKQLHGDVQEIINSSKRATELVKRILTFSRQDDRILQPVNLFPIVSESVNMLSSTIPTTVNLTEKLDYLTKPVMADSTGIQQIVLNLCTNALHSLLNQKGTIHISLNSRYFAPEECNTLDIPHPGEYVVLSVSDTGVGMNDHTIKHIFEPYFTTKELGSGTGLGLAAVHGIVDSYNGYIRVDSTVEKGSTFTIILPACQNDLLPRKHKHQNREDNSADDKENHQKCIMIVDDEPSICRLQARKLQQKGYLTEAFTEPQQALDEFALSPTKYSLVITDQTMPGMSGKELSEKLLYLDHSLPIILFTGHSDIIDEKAAIQLGIKRFIMKPISDELLYDVVQQCSR